jgi:hypothetical protein
MLSPPSALRTTPSLSVSDPTALGATTAAPWRKPVMVALRSLVLATASSLVFAATAHSCAAPPSGHWSGTFSGFASGTWDTMQTESAEMPPGSGITETNGMGTVNDTSHGFMFEGAFGGIVNCGVVEATWHLHGSFNDEILYKGTYQSTEASGTWTDTFEHASGTWSGTVFPAAQSQGSQPGTVEVHNPPNTQASSITIAPVNQSQLPPSTVAPNGALSFGISQVPSGGTIDVTLLLPPGSAPTEVLKLVGGEFKPYPAGKTTINGDEVTLKLTDNEAPWDENPELGVILDPVVPVRPQTGPAPTIRKLAPKKGSTAGGTSVTITGANFSEVTAVRFGSTMAAQFTVSSPTSLTAVSPAGTKGTVAVSVGTHNGGTSAASKKARFTYRDRHRRSAMHHQNRP